MTNVRLSFVKMHHFVFQPILLFFFSYFYHNEKKEKMKSFSEVKYNKPSNDIWNNYFLLLVLLF